MGHLPECSETYEAGNVIHSDLKIEESLELGDPLSGRAGPTPEDYSRSRSLLGLRGIAEQMGALSALIA
jgi:hypothetical protein